MTLALQKAFFHLIFFPYFIDKPLAFCKECAFSPLLKDSLKLLMLSGLLSVDKAYRADFCSLLGQVSQMTWTDFFPPRFSCKMILI